MEKIVSKFVNRFLNESFVDITDKTADEAFQEVTEKLHGKQHRLDVAKPKGKLTGADFKKLRSMKEGGEIEEKRKMSPVEYKKIKQSLGQPMKEEEDSSGILTFDKYKKLKKKLEDEKASYKNEFMEEAETEEGNAFTGALSKARAEGNDSFEVDGKTYSVRESINNRIGVILERRKQRLERKALVKENKVQFTESELINFIERLVESELKADKNTTKSLDMSKKVNSDATQETVKKMKEYMKNMGQDYNDNTEEFPKGNKIMARQGKDGEVKDDIKKAYKASSEIEEYIENFTAAGLENLDYDNIKPNEDWVSDNIEGSSRTGNNPEWANAVKTDVNKKLNQRRIENLLAVLKRQAYNKTPQPVHSDEAGESVPSSLEGKKNMKVNKLTGESIQKTKVINEMEKMKKLITYNQKTQ